MGWANCKNANTCGHTICFEKACKNYAPREKDKQTKADRIRAMSDEELAHLLASVQINFAVALLKKLECPTEEIGACLEETKKEFLEFLKQPANCGGLTMDNKCVCCGADIPEGRQVCPKCEGGVEDGKDNKTAIR